MAESIRDEGEATFAACGGARSAAGANPPLPPWLKVKIRKRQLARATRDVLHEVGVHTVCEEARCPNIGECFSCGTATFLIMGPNCTRHCRFCAVHSARPLPLDPEEPKRVAQAAARLKLRHVVVTSVTRDDLPDGGAGHFAATCAAIRKALPQATVELLIPDCRGDAAALETIFAARPDVLNHNLETVRRLTPRVRPEADYDRSLRVLRLADRWRREHGAPMLLKSGLMVGLGETFDEVLQALEDMRATGCEMVTVGQYLRPSPAHLPVARYVPPEEFGEIERAAREMGFKFVAAGPFVRSSYRAAEAVAQSARAKEER